jgi:hypothetical protein
MVNMRRLRLVLLLLVVSAAEADTVTLRDSSSWNGRVTISVEGVLNLAANFRAGKTITLTFGANWVRSIQFNPTAYNPGSEPTNLPQKPSGGPFPFPGIIYLQDRTSKDCKSITIDRPDLSRLTVSCDGNPFPDGKPIRGGKPIPVIRIVVNTQ